MKIKFSLFALATYADVFLHSPRGSNNRLNEASVERDTNNRLFDSQNNDNGGYNVGDHGAKSATSVEEQHSEIYFQSGKKGFSQLHVEWWNQHGCGQRNDRDGNTINCQIILQYMCDENLKNGFSRNRPEFTAGNDLDESENQMRRRKERNENANKNRGRHESWQYYDACRKRPRNSGLFVADQDIDENNNFGFAEATKTRQNSNGGQNGFECPEERDYYPYWHPTPWIDIAVLTSDVSMRNYYRQESFNRKTKYECVEFYDDEKTERRHFSSANNEADCLKNNGIWQEFSSYLEIIDSVDNARDCRKMKTKKSPKGSIYRWAVPYIDGEGREKVPEEKCLLLPPPVDIKMAPWARANHLGNEDRNNDLPNYKWKLPHFPQLDETNEKQCVLRIRYNISSDDYDWGTSSTSGVDFRGDPTVEAIKGLNLQLAVDTAQIGRTFQDRTHIFKIKSRPSEISDSSNLYNIQVRGKRGNIQQTFPAVEYDFTPNSMIIKKEDLVHLQWTGSNNNPKNFAGEGTDQTDRNNIYPMGDNAGRNTIDPISEVSGGMFKNAEWVWSSHEISGENEERSENLAISFASSGFYHCKSQGQCDNPATRGDLDAQLNNANASYHGNVVKFTPGTYYYMSTRNNNFSNRAQKADIKIEN